MESRPLRLALVGGGNISPFLLRQLYTGCGNPEDQLMGPTNQVLPFRCLQVPCPTWGCRWYLLATLVCSPWENIFHLLFYTLGHFLGITIWVRNDDSTSSASPPRRGTDPISINHFQMVSLHLIRASADD